MNDKFYVMMFLLFLSAVLLIVPLVVSLSQQNDQIELTQPKIILLQKS